MKIHIPEVPPGIIQQKANIKHFDIQAKVIRADGTIEDYGTIVGWDRNLLKHLLLQIKIIVTRFKIKWHQY